MASSKHWQEEHHPKNLWKNNKHWQNRLKHQLLPRWVTNNVETLDLDFLYCNLFIFINLTPKLTSLKISSNKIDKLSGILSIESGK